MHRLAPAERPPYGKGTKTLMDTLVRDRWQIYSSKIRIVGLSWNATLKGNHMHAHRQRDTRNTAIQTIRIQHQPIR